MQTIHCNHFEENRFKTISEFKDCVIRGGEIEFEWKGVGYTVSRDENGVLSIAEWYKPETDCECDGPDEVLEYMVAGDRLRDVITQVKVWARTL